MKKKIKEKECASYKRYDFEIWISNDGKYVSRCGKNGHVGKPLKINDDVDGPFVLSASEHAVRIRTTTTTRILNGSLTIIRTRLMKRRWYIGRVISWKFVKMERYGAMGG